MFKEVVQIKATCTIIGFDFIIVLLIVVVVVFILTKGNAFMYGFVMIILSPRGRLLHAVALRACFWDKILISFPVCFFSWHHSCLEFLILLFFSHAPSFPSSLPSLDCLQIWYEKKVYNVPLHFSIKSQKQTIANYVNCHKQFRTSMREILVGVFCKKQKLKIEN